MATPPYEFFRCLIVYSCNITARRWTSGTGEKELTLMFIYRVGKGNLNLRKRKVF